MTDLASPFASSRTPLSLGRAARVVGAAFGWLATRWQHRREIRQLSEFDDRMLKDIGLTRSEVEGALTEPFFHDRAFVLVRWNESQARLEPVNPARPSKPLPRTRPTVGFSPSSGCCA